MTHYQEYIKIARDKRGFAKKHKYTIEDVNYILAVMQNGASLEDAKYMVFKRYFVKEYGRYK